MGRQFDLGERLTKKLRFDALVIPAEYESRVGGLLGLLVGDAIGVPLEFHSPDDLPPRSKIDMVPPVGFRRSHAGVPPGTWSDDGSQALCLLASLIECGKLSLDDFSAKLVQWLYHGYMAVDGDVFDVGIQTEDAISKLSDGESPHESGGRSVMDNGNGSLMRVLPLALWHTGDDMALVLNAHRQSLPTHAHPRSMVACAFYCLVARGYLQAVIDPWTWAAFRLEECYTRLPEQSGGSDFLAEFDRLKKFGETETPRGTGYVLDTIWSAREALMEESFEDVIRTAVLLGEDTDTTAAVAGGLAGIKFGVDAIPKRWLKRLRGFELVGPLMAPFLEQVETQQKGSHAG